MGICSGDNPTEAYILVLKPRCVGGGGGAAPACAQYIVLDVAPVLGVLARSVPATDGGMPVLARRGSDTE